MIEDIGRFVVTSHRDGAGTMLKLEGDLDMATEEQLRLGFDRFVGADAAAVVLDMSELNFIDAAGLHTVLSLRDRCEAEGRALFVVRGRECVQRVISICGVEPDLPAIADPSELPEPLPFPGYGVKAGSLAHAR